MSREADLQSGSYELKTTDGITPPKVCTLALPSYYPSLTQTPLKRSPKILPWMPKNLPYIRQQVPQHIL
jgi:hypothetical protein